MIRIAKTTDLPDLQRITKSTDMFLGDELASFMSEMEAHLLAAGGGKPQTAALLVPTHKASATAPVTGAAYFAPEMMAQGVMNLLFIGVLPEHRRQGVAQGLLDEFEQAVQRNNARLAIIETASDDMFAPAWRLYKKAGYREEARIRDFYYDGLDKLVFRKRLK